MQNIHDYLFHIGFLLIIPYSSFVVYLLVPLMLKKYGTVPFLYGKTIGASYISLMCGITVYLLYLCIVKREGILNPFFKLIFRELSMYFPVLKANFDSALLLLIVSASIASFAIHLFFVFRDKKFPIPLRILVSLFSAIITAPYFVL